MWWMMQRAPVYHVVVVAASNISKSQRRLGQQRRGAPWPCHERCLQVHHCRGTVVRPSRHRRLRLLQSCTHRLQPHGPKRGLHSIRQCGARRKQPRAGGSLRTSTRAEVGAQLHLRADAHTYAQNLRRRRRRTFNVGEVPVLNNPPCLKRHEEIEVGPTLAVRRGLCQVVAAQVEIAA